MSKRNSMTGWPSLQTSANAPPQRKHHSRHHARTRNKHVVSTMTGVTNENEKPLRAEKVGNTEVKEIKEDEIKTSSDANRGGVVANVEKEADSLDAQIAKLDFENCNHADVVQAFTYWYTEFPDVAIAVAVVKALTWAAQNSKATTIMEFQEELKKDIQKLCTQTTIASQRAGLSLTASCELFNRYVTRVSFDHGSFDECRRRLVERGLAFAQRSLNCRRVICDNVYRFISDNKVLLIHGNSRVVNQALIHAAEKGKQFRVVVTEGREGNSAEGYSTAKVLSQAGIPVTICLDAAVGYIMETVDMVLMGAAAVVENGGVINKIGSYQTAMVAKGHKKPVYVAAESYKFARLFLLNQTDVKNTPAGSSISCVPSHLSSKLPSDSPLLEVNSSPSDYTPPEYITLLFTDIGILTTSAVSDELIKLYY